MTSKSELTANNLKNQILQARNTGNVSPVFPNNRIIGSFSLTIQDHGSQEIAAKNIHFVDCIFENEFIIKSYQILQSLSFENCEFEKGVYLEEISYTIDFKGTNVFKGDCFLKFTSPRLKNLSNIKIFGVFTISGQFNDFTIEDINLENESQGTLILTNSELHSLKISNSSFKEVLLGQRRTSIRNSIQIKGAISKSINIGLTALGGNLGFDGCSFEIVTIQKIKENNLNLIADNTSIHNSLHLELDNLGHSKLSKCNLQKVTLSGNLAKEKSLIIQDSFISNLRFDNVVNDGSIIVRHIQFLAPSLSLLSSNLGKTDFINCNFSNATFEFENSKVTEVFLSDTKFPKKVNLMGIVSNEQARLAFGQLNSASQKQGDSVTALEFQSREIEAHYNILLSAKKFFNLTFLNLLLSKISNDFGRNWGRSCFFTLIAGFLSFYTLVLSTPEYSFDFSFTSFNDFVPAFFRFMNPLRFFDLDMLFKEMKAPLSFNFLSYLLDFLGRIFVAYGVYQTIQSFRRFGRK